MPDFYLRIALQSNFGEGDCGAFLSSKLIDGTAVFYLKDFDGDNVIFDGG